MAACWSLRSRCSQGPFSGAGCEIFRRLGEQSGRGRWPYMLRTLFARISKCGTKNLCSGIILGNKIKLNTFCWQLVYLAVLLLLSKTRVILIIGKLRLNLNLTVVSKASSHCRSDDRNILDLSISMSWGQTVGKHCKKIIHVCGALEWLPQSWLLCQRWVNTVEMP